MRSPAYAAVSVAKSRVLSKRKASEFLEDKETGFFALQYENLRIQDKKLATCQCLTIWTV